VQLPIKNIGDVTSVSKPFLYPYGSIQRAVMAERIKRDFIAQLAREILGAPELLNNLGTI